MRSVVIGPSVIVVAALLALAGCVYQPLHGGGFQSQSSYGATLSQIWVEEVDTRVGQQVRNHLIFLLQNGRDDPEARYLAKLRIIGTNREFAAVEGVRDQTAGSVTVSVSYDLLDTETRQIVAEGNRIATASYDRTPQNFANSRARRDAENRAAREAAEMLRLALASDLSSI